MPPVREPEKKKTAMQRRQSRESPIVVADKRKTNELKQERESTAAAHERSKPGDFDASYCCTNGEK
nr:hypothetical protein Itr_chr10CG09610 [Ipomoea trifida]